MPPLREEAAQATVEMAVVAPVLLVLALIVYNLMVFAAATARFDRIAPDVVIAHGVAPAGGSDVRAISDSAGFIAAEIGRAMEGYGVEVEVTCDAVSGEGDLLALAGVLRTYRCTMRYAPWPAGASIAGVSLGAPPSLVHERSVTIDPWRPGVLV